MPRVLSPDVYERQAAKSAEYQRNLSAKVRDIGPAPEVQNIKLRESTESDLEAFLREFFYDVFPWPFSPSQKRSIQRLQHIIENGGLAAEAQPRGTGKTQRAIRAALWAILTGKRHYPIFVGATDGLAGSAMTSVKTIIVHNEELRSAYTPEVHGFRQLNGSNRAAAGQLSEGVPTGIYMGADRIVFPALAGSAAADSVFEACGITSALRGKFHTRQSGKAIRPDWVMIDDPQTKESARNPQQTQKRFETIHGDILGLAGPSTRISAVVLCTVIEENDLSSRILNEPKWQGVLSKRIISFPKNMQVWDQYFQKHDELTRLKQASEINDFYRSQQATLEEGCVLEWPEQIVDGDVSPIQSAMHKYHEVGESAFAAEYQNEPLVTQAVDRPELGGLSQKTIGMPRGLVPSWATQVTAAIDVQKNVLYYAVIAWAEDFTGHVIEYGAFPKQNRLYFTTKTASPTLESASGIPQEEGFLRWGLDNLSNLLAGHEWQRENGGTVRISRLVVDANWGPRTDVVYEFCKRSPNRSIILPAHGIGIGAKDNPMVAVAKKAGERHGWHWVIKPPSASKFQNHFLIHDTNHFKEFLSGRIQLPLGVKSTLSIFGTKPEEHSLLEDHLISEYAVKTSGRGRELWEFKLKPGFENHWLDCLSMCCVGASINGIRLNDVANATQSQRRVANVPKRR